MSSGVKIGTAEVTSTTAAAPPRAVVVDSKAAMAQTDVARFCGFMAQLGLLLAVFYLYDLEEQVFGILSLLIVGGFAVHYWLPFQWKETFYIGWSLLGAFVLLPPAAA